MVAYNPDSSVHRTSVSMFRRVSKSNNNNAASSLQSANTSSYRGRSNFGGGPGRGNFNNRNHAKQKPGLFADGIWLCDCIPHLPAEHFKVKKEGRNKGRWFYTCQNSEGRRCGFFLWDEDAKPREEAAVLAGKRSEPEASTVAHATVSGAGGRNAVMSREGGTPQKANVDSQMSTQTQQPVGPPPVHPSQQNSPATLGRNSRGNISTSNMADVASKKRPLSVTGFQFDDDDYDDDDVDAFPWAFTGQEEAELAKLAQPPETPRKKAQKTDSYATPASTAKRQLPWIDYSAEAPLSASSAARTTTAATPSRSMVPDSLPTPSLTKPSAKASAGADTTPTPGTRFRDALADTPGPSALMDDVLDTLRASRIALAPDAAGRLRAVLHTHHLRAQGISRGRDMVRLALKARDAKIVELGARIQALEAEREVDRARIRGLRLKDSRIV